jgi:A-macroglobulin TED domain/A-macroglobulin receptor binding domain
MEQTSSAAYPNILVADYVKKARVANPQILMKAEQYLNVGYQKLLTFERPGGGFDWWGNGEPLVWLSAYGLQEFSDMAKVYPIDRGVIDRTQAFLMKKMDKDGTWSNIGATHGESIASMGNPKLLLTSYVVWSMLESGYDKKPLQKSVQYIRDNLGAAGDSAYILALAANALAAYDAKDDSTLEAVKRLDKLRQDLPEWKAVRFPGKGMSLTYAHADGMTAETTALAALAMIRTGEFTNSANQALTYLIKSKAGNGTWGSTQATILALKALIAGMGASPVKGTTHFTVSVNGKEAAGGKVDADNVDVMQTFDLAKLARTGGNQVEIAVDGETNLMYQVVGRYYEPWNKVAPTEKPVLEVAVDYDRTKLSTNDTLHAKATLKYHGKVPTYMVMLDLGIAPGFVVDPGDFAEMVGKKQIQRFTLTARTVTLYLGDVKPGDVLTFEYSLKAKHALRARSAPTVAYEYYTPANRAEAAPVELTVDEK